jgi:hypothetical protein
MYNITKNPQSNLQNVKYTITAEVQQLQQEKTQVSKKIEVLKRSKETNKVV